MLPEALRLALGQQAQEEPLLMPDILGHPDKSGVHSLGPVGAERPSPDSPTVPLHQGYRTDKGLRGDVRWPDSCMPVSFACDAITGGDPPNFLEDILGVTTWTPLKPRRRKANCPRF